MASGKGGFPRGSAADLAPEQLTILIDFTGYRCAPAPRRLTRRPFRLCVRVGEGG